MNNYKKTYESKKEKAMESWKKTLGDYQKKNPKAKKLKGFESYYPPTRYDVGYKKYIV